MTVRIPPAVLDSPVMRAALAAHDISRAYKLLIAAGLNQRDIAALVGMSPSEVSEIITGRRVQSVAVLERIAKGLGVRPGLMGLVFTYDGLNDLSGERVEEVDEDVERRNFISAVAGPVVWGHPVLTELLSPSHNAPTPLPSRLSPSDVTALSNLTEQMRGLARHYGGQADTISAIARRYTALMGIDGPAQVKVDLGSALSELHTLAGWSAFDSQAHPDAVRGHFTRALELATEAGDGYRASNAIYHAAMTMQNEAPDESLKLVQLAQFRLGQGSSHPRTDTLNSWLHLDSAHSLIMLGHDKQARTSLARAREGWSPEDAFDAADFDHVTALAHRDLGMIDSAESLAATSVATWGAEHRRDAVQASTTLAALRVSAGHPGGLDLAHRTIADIAELYSQRARDRLSPLVSALATRSDGTARQLAQHARAVMAGHTSAPMD